MPSRQKVIVIGWDSADWNIINPLLDNGEMPALQSLIEQGVCGNISTLDPIISPMLWTSIATGKHAYKHGILGFAEPDDKRESLRPTQVTSRQAKALWNILNQNGYISHVINWWPSHPAEPINGITVSNLFCKAKFNQELNDWKVTPNAIHPPHLTEQLAEYRVHPRELTPAHILPFVPEAALIDQEIDDSLAILAAQIAESATIQNVATYILDQDKDWNFMGIYFEAPDLISHSFMKFHPPKLERVDEKKYQLYHQVVNSTYKLHDMMLGRLLELLDSDTTIVLLSDHGFYSDNNRILDFPKEPAAIAKEHRPLGIFVAKGPNIKKDERIYGASILDITPTILALFGLPIGSDMDGKPLTQIFETPITIQTISSWEDIKGNDGQHNASTAAGSMEIDEELLEQLSDLGYIDSIDVSKSTKADLIKNNINEAQFYRARSFLTDNKIHDAIYILENLCAQKPTPERYLNYLLIAYLKINQVSKVEELLKSDIKITEHNRLLLDAELLSRKNKYKQAINKLLKADEIQRQNHKTLYALGNAYSQIDDFNKAIYYYNASLDTNPEQYNVYFKKGIALSSIYQFDEALDAFLDAVGIQYYNPNIHYHIGKTLFELQSYDQSAQALDICLRMMPHHKMALELIKKVYVDILNTPQKFEALFENGVPDRPLIYIVSGLPRSGTSMMMQILEAAGMPIYKDDIRIADSNNPKGYYEHEAVKMLNKDKNWIKDAKDKVIKVVTPIVPHLPDFCAYKIIFMDRDIDEVVISQYTMLANLGKIPKNTEILNMKQKLLQLRENVADYLQGRDNIEYILINYNNLLNYDPASITLINIFFDLQINNELLSNIIDKNLYRSINSVLLDKK